MYDKINKGVDALTGLTRFVQQTGVFYPQIFDLNPDNPANSIRVEYWEIFETHTGVEVKRELLSYTEAGERATRWYLKEIPNTNIAVGRDVIAPAINAFLTENLP